MNRMFVSLRNALLSSATRWLVAALAICAPIHAVFAQSQTGDVVVAITGGNYQTGTPNSTLATPLSVSFSGSSYASASTVYWTVEGDATLTESGTTTYETTTSLPGNSSVHLQLGSTPGSVTVYATCDSMDCTNIATFTETIAAQNVMSIVGGNNQSAQTDSYLNTPLTVGFSGSGAVTVDWTINSGHGAIFAQSSTDTYSQSLTTSPGSTSSVDVILGSTSGAFTITATCATGCTGGNNSVTFDVTATPAPKYLEMSKVSGDGQSGTANSTLPMPLVVRLTPTPSGFDGPFTIPVVWKVVSGTATFAANHGTSYTDNVELPLYNTFHQQNQQSSSGLSADSQVSIELGSTAGPVVITANCSDCSYGKTRTFNLTITPSGTLQIVSGNDQSGIVGSASVLPLVVQYGTESGQTVEWSVISGQVTLNAESSQTDDQGRASMGFTYGSTPGTATIQASAGGVSAVFTVNAVAAASPTPAGGNNQVGTVGMALQPFVVQLGPGSSTGGHVQAAGAPGAYANIAVTWTVVQGGGSLASMQTFTDADGRASNVLTLGPVPGTNVVQAAVAGAGSTTFTATAVGSVGAGGTFTLVSGSNQALVPGQASQPLVVKVADSDGNALSGIGITWTASSSNANLASATTSTGSDGTSQNTLTVVLPGDYTVSAQITGVPDIPALTFTFSNGVANLPTLSGPQLSTAQVIDKACPALAASTQPLTPQQQDFLQRCSELVVGSSSDPAQVPGALDAMLNNKALPQRTLAQGVQVGQYNNLNTRLAELRQGTRGFNIGGLTLSQDGRSLPLAMLGNAFRKDPKDDEVGKDFSRWGFFATGAVDRGGNDATAVRPGFDYHNASLTAGVDYRFTADFVAGLALGYNANRSSLDQDLGKLDVDGYSFNGYFSWYHGDYYVEGSLVYNWLNYDFSRHISYQIDSLSGGGTTLIDQTASASPDGQQSSFALSFGRDFNHKAWSFGPYLRGILSHLSLDEFSESMSDPGAPGAGLGTSVDSRSMSSLLGVLGGRVSYTTSQNWGILVPNATLEWNHEFRNDPQTAVVRFLADPTQTPIVLTDNAPDSSYFNVGIGLNAILPQGRSGYVYLEHLVGSSGAHENRLSIGIRIEF